VGRKVGLVSQFDIILAADEKQSNFTRLSLSIWLPFAFKPGKLI
jgi:hypothetical protein